MEVSPKMKLLALKFSILGLVLSCAAFAQNASISGTASSESGSPLANATVNLSNLDTGAKQQAATDSSGHYAFNGLAAGRYQISVAALQATGTPSQEITLAADQAKQINITMQSPANTTAPATVATFRVEDATPALDTYTPQIVNVYNTRYIQYNEQPNYLAPNGSIFGSYNLSMLSAGLGTNAGLGIARGPVVGGQRSSSNNFYVEGVDNNNRAVPGPLVYVSNEAATELHAFQNQFPPEWGHTLGGQFSQIVRTGTNQFHGSLYDYLQNRNLNAIDQRFANQGIRDLPRYDQNRMGLNFGAPVIKNALFFFGSFEFIPLGFDSVPGSPVFAPTAAGFATLAGLTGVSQTNLGVLRNFVGPAPTQSSSTTVNGVQIPIGILPIRTHQYQNQYIGTGSIDWTIRNSDQVRARYVHNETHANDNGAVLPAFFSPLKTRALLASIAEYHNFSPVMVNELRLGYTRYHSGIHNNGVTFPGLGVFPNIQIQNDLNLQLGAGLLAGQTAALNTYQISDNMSWTRGHHVFKIGGEGRRFIGPISLAQLGLGNYSFTTLGRFLTDLPPDIAGQRSFGNLNYAGNNWDTFFYLNDSWQMSPNFNVNLGVKYSYVTIPKTLTLQGLNSIADVPGVLTFHEPETQKTAFGPLIGIAWSPGFVKNTVFRAGFGMNYDTTYLASAIPSIPPGVVTTVFSNTLSLVPGFFGFGGIITPTAFNVFTPSVTPAEARARTTTFIPDQRLPYSMQWNAGIQQQVFHRLVLDVRYLGVKSVHLPTEGILNGVSPITATQNLPLFFSQPSQATLNGLTTNLNTLRAISTNPFASAGFANPISSIQPQGWSWYNGLAVQASQRFSGGLQMLLSYTWSHMLDNLSGPLFNRAGFFTLTERAIQPGTSIFDHRHRASATFLWDIGAIGPKDFHFVRDILANMTFGTTYTYESPSNLFLESGLNSDLTGFGTAGVFLNPNGAGFTGSGVTALRNSSGQVVGYLATNPNARFIAAGPGSLPNGGRAFLQTNPVQNFDATLFKRFSVRDLFSFEIHGEAYNLFNHPQFTAAPIRGIAAQSQLNPNLLIPGTAAFGNISQAFSSNARTLQVGIRFLF